MTLQEKINAIQNSTELSDSEKTEQISEVYKEFDTTAENFKNTQASFTKSQQEKIEMAKILVEQNPSNVEKIPDEKVRNKIIQEKWGVNTLEQLKYIYPDYAKKASDDDGDEDLTELEKLQREVKFMKLQGINTKTKEAMNELSEKFGEVVNTIPDFNEKLQEELKSISEGLDPKVRVEKAFKLVVNNNTSTANAFSIMQGISMGSSKVEKKDEDRNKNKSPLNDAFKNALNG